MEGRKVRNWQNLQVTKTARVNRLNVQFMSHLGGQTDYELTQAIGRGVISGIGDLYERHRATSLCVMFADDW